MSEAIRLRHVAGGPQGIGAVQIEVYDQALIGQAAELSFQVLGEIKRSDGLDASWGYPSRALTLRADQTVDLPEVLTAIYPFKGKNLSVRVTATLALESRGFGKIGELELGVVERSESSAARHADPYDSFDSAKSFKFLPLTARLKLIGLFIAGFLVIGTNLLIGFHDQIVTNPANAYFYDNVGKWGSESPVIKALLGSGVLGLVVLLAIRRQYLRYFTLESRDGCLVEHQGRIAINELVSGRAAVDLEGLTLRLVAINFERGQYQVRNKSRWETHSFREPVRAVVLFSQPLPPMKKGQLLEHVFSGEVDIDPAYEQLLPPYEIDGGATGIDVGLVIQLRHKDLLDHKVEGPQIFDPKLFRPRLRPPASA